MLFRSGIPRKLLTGDTLFIGDVGRPDLVGAKGLSPEQMAALLYDSLHTKILPLPDDVEVYPAHGAGSSCGRNISTKTWSTLGEQRRTNYALQSMSRDEFVARVASELPPPPAYFAHDAEENRLGPRRLAELPPPLALSPKEVQSQLRAGAVALDVRGAAGFGTAHLPGALNIGLSGQFASWAVALIPVDRQIVVVADDRAGAEEAVLRLARVGMEHVAGYLDGGIAAWDAAGLPLSSLPQMPVEELRAQIEEGAPLAILDVRRPGEYTGGHVPGALSTPLDRLAPALDPSRRVAVLCQSGYRSSAACSLLAARGFVALYNVTGGTAAWIAAGYPVERGS